MAGSLSLTTYNNLDGTSSAMRLYNQGFALSDNASVNIGVGDSRGTKGNMSEVAEGKVNYNFNNHFSAQGRARYTMNSDSMSQQYRVSVGYKTNVADNTTFYINPYIAEKNTVGQSEWKTDIGFFTGVKQNVGDNLTFSLEGQKYNGLNPMGSKSGDWSVNASVCYTF